MTEGYKDNGWKFGVGALVLVALLLCFAAGDPLFGPTTAYNATIVSMHADEAGGLSGGVIYTAVLDINGERHAIYVKRATDFYQFQEGQSVTLYRKTSLLTGWWVSNRIEP